MPTWLSIMMWQLMIGHSTNYWYSLIIHKSNYVKTCVECFYISTHIYRDGQIKQKHIKKQVKMNWFCNTSHESAVPNVTSCSVSIQFSNRHNYKQSALLLIM